MNCVFCKFKKTIVVDKRDNLETNSTRRRRECLNCKKRFTTYERIENILINVIKRDGRMEEFDREKLKRAVLKATNKRGIEEEKIKNMIEEIETEIVKSGKDKVTSNEIGDLLLAKLFQIDELGGILFASVYKEFKDLSQLQEEINRLVTKE